MFQQISLIILALVVVGLMLVWGFDIGRYKTSRTPDDTPPIKAPNKASIVKSTKTEDNDEHITPLKPMKKQVVTIKRTRYDDNGKRYVQSKRVNIYGRSVQQRTFEKYRKTICYERGLL